MSITCPAHPIIALLLQEANRFPFPLKWDCKCNEIGFLSLDVRCCDTSFNPGSNYSVMEEGNYLRAANRDEHTPPLQPGQCLIHYPHSFAETKEVMENGWQEYAAAPAIHGWLTNLLPSICIRLHCTRTEADAAAWLWENTCSCSVCFKAAYTSETIYPNKKAFHLNSHPSTQYPTIRNFTSCMPFYCLWALPLEQRPSRGSRTCNGHIMLWYQSLTLRSYNS